MSDGTINLETEGESPVAFTDVLRLIHERPDKDCAAAWEFFDELLPGETMDIVNKFAALGWKTPAIYEQLRKHMPPAARDWPPRMHEMIALEIEHAVRRQSMTAGLH